MPAQITLHATDFPPRTRLVDVQRAMRRLGYRVEWRGMHILAIRLH